MNASERQSLQEAALWMARHAGFPAVRLEPQAEALVCMALMAGREAAAQPARARFDVRSGAQRSAQKQWALRRSQVHFKCDNSAKV
ncbi:MAG: hypothetical protein JNL39_21735 [Opitutaceae bacterium]|nr:hypothetical protein [Opitutaceae bacterium]